MGIKRPQGKFVGLPNNSALNQLPNLPIPCAIKIPGAAASAISANAAQDIIISANSGAITTLETNVSNLIQCLGLYIVLHCSINLSLQYYSEILHQFI